MESVQHILPAAAPVGAALIQQFRERFPRVIVREGMIFSYYGYGRALDIIRQTILLTFTSYHILLGWGMSELSPLALLNPLHAPRDGSCGIAVPNCVFKVADVSSGENLEPNKEGEICCKGPMVAYTTLDTFHNQEPRPCPETSIIISFIFIR